MNHWHKYKNYKRRENGDGTYSYFIIVDGIDVEVNEDVYRVYASSGRKMKYMELDLKRDRAVQDENGRTVVDENGLPVVLPEREVSLDKLVGEDWDFPSDEPGPEEVVMQKMEYEELHRCLGLLDDDERSLIQALFFESNTEREYAKTLGISKTALHARKVNVLAKLKILLES